MYEEFYGLRENPFSIVPDPDFLFLSRSHDAALNILESELREQRGFTLLSGEVGSGKTLLVRHLTRRIGDRATVGIITNTPRNCSSMLEWILQALCLDFHGKDRAQQHEILMRFLESQRARKRQTVLIIDEAHNLDIQALEELPVLLHLNTASTVPVHLLLVGQPEIREILSDRRGWLIGQLITLHFRLLPLTFRETSLYIRHRIQSVGGAPDLFDPEACAVIYLLSDGLPRLINALCNSSLVSAYGKERMTIGSDTVIDVTRSSARGGFIKLPGLDEDFDPEETLNRARKLCQGPPPVVDGGQSDPPLMRPLLGETRNLPDPEAQINRSNELSLFRRDPIAEYADASVEPVGDTSSDAQATPIWRSRKLRYVAFGEVTLAVLTIAGIVAVFSAREPEDRGLDIIQNAYNAGSASSPSKPGQFSESEQAEGEPSGGYSGETAPTYTPAPPSSEIASARPSFGTEGGVPSSATESAPLSQAGESATTSPHPGESVAAIPPAAVAPDRLIAAEEHSVRPPSNGLKANQASRKDEVEPDGSMKRTRSLDPPTGSVAATAAALSAAAGGDPENDAAKGAQPWRDVPVSPPPGRSGDAASAGEDRLPEPAEQDAAPISPEESPAGETVDLPAESETFPASRPRPTASVPANRVDAPPPVARIEPDPPAQSDGIASEPRNADSDAASYRVAPNDGPAVAAVPVPEVEVATLPPTKVDRPASDLTAILARPDSGEYVKAFEALFGIWKLDYASLAGGAPCHKAFSSGLSCYEREGTLARLRRLGLPAIIGLKRPGGDLAYAVLAGMSRSHAKLRFADETVTAPIGEVSGRLSGPFILLWKTPIPFTGNMRIGSSGANVKSLRDALDRIMPEGYRPGEGSDFDVDVTRAVKEFQRTHGLYEDGVVGAETLIAIHKVLYRGQLPELGNL